MDVKISKIFVLVLAAFTTVTLGGREEEIKRAYMDNVSRAMADGGNLQLPPSSSGRSEAVEVGVDFSLTAVTDLNKKKGYAELEAFLTTSWKDPRLELSHHLKGMVDRDETLRVLVKPGEIWTPDIELWNAVHPGVQLINSKPVAVISDSGDVSIINKVRTRSICDVTGQIGRSHVANCTVRFGSWAHDGNKLRLTINSPPSALLDNFQLASAWNVTSASAWISTKIYECCPEPYPYASFSFLLKKRGRK